MSKEEDVAQRLEDACAIGRGLLREIHAATKDLRKENDRTEKLIRRSVEEEMGAEIKRQLSELQVVIAASVRAADERVCDHFEDLANRLLGKGTAGDLTKLAETVAADRAEQIHAALHPSITVETFDRNGHRGNATIVG